MSNTTTMGAIAQRSANQGHAFGRTMTAYTPPELSAEGRARLDALHALRRRGISVPPRAFDDVDRDLPESTVRSADHLYAALWPRPNALNAPDLSGFDLTQAQAAWDASSKVVTARREAMATVAEIKETEATDRADRDAEREREWAEAQARRADLDAIPRVMSPARMWD